MRISIQVVFIIAGVISLTIASVVAWRMSTLQSYVDAQSQQTVTNWQNSVLASTQTMLATIDKEITRCLVLEDSLSNYLLYKLNGPAPPDVSTFAASLAAFNQTFFDFYQPAMWAPNQVEGFGINFVYPRTATSPAAFTAVNSLQTYLDHNPDNTTLRAQGWGNVSTGNMDAYAVARDSTTGVLSNSGYLYTINAMFMVTNSFGQTNYMEVLPWQWADGSVSVYFQISRWINAKGAYVVPQLYGAGKSSYWAEGMNLVAPDGGPLKLILYALGGTKVGNVAYTGNIPEATAAYNQCFQNATNNGGTFDLVSACVLLPMETHPASIVRQAFTRIVKPAVFGFVDFLPGQYFAYHMKSSVNVLGENLYLIGIGQTMNIVSDRVTVNLLVALIIFVAVVTNVTIAVSMYAALLVPLNSVFSQMDSVKKLDFSALEVEEDEPSPRAGDDTKTTVTVVDKGHVRQTRGSQRLFKETRDLENHFRSLAASIKMFSMFVPREVLRDLITMESSTSITVRNITVMFSDIVGFTALSEKLPCQDLQSLLNLFFDVSSRTVLKHGGTIDKYIGDCVMAFWGAPLDFERQADSACCAALHMINSIYNNANAFEAICGTAVQLRTGIHSGPASVGVMGSSFRSSYTAVGDTVNTAARLEGATRRMGVEVLVSGDVAAQLDHAVYVLFRCGAVRVKGKDDTTETYALLGIVANEPGDVSSGGFSGRTSHRTDDGTTRHSTRVKKALLSVTEELSLAAGTLFALSENMNAISQLASSAMAQFSMGQLRSATDIITKLLGDPNKVLLLKQARVPLQMLETVLAKSQEALNDPSKMEAFDPVNAFTEK